MVLFQTLFLISVVVVTSNYDLYYIASKIADPSFEIYYLLDESEISQEDFDLTDFHVRLLNRADIFIHTGTFEKRWLPQALWKARNPKILEGREGHIDISKYINGYADSNCFILNREYVKRVASILSGFFRKLSPDFSSEFYEKRLSEFISEVDNFFYALQATVSSFVVTDFAIYSPCLKYLTDNFNLKYGLLIKKSESERFTYGLARDSSEVMRRMKINLLLVPHNIERSAEIGFMSAEIFMLKIPVHLGRKYPDLSSILGGILFIGDIEKFRKNISNIQGKVEKEKKEIEEKISSIPPEKEVTPLEEYAYISSKYTSLILRDRPSSQAAQAGKISGGSRVLVLEKQNEWVKVTDGKNIGWVRSSVLEFEK
jgi:ABC-type Zn uptake system ZnuABC Zn-binding protein ZnuA